MLKSKLGKDKRSIKDQYKQYIYRIFKTAFPVAVASMNSLNGVWKGGDFAGAAWDKAREAVQVVIDTSVQKEIVPFTDEVCSVQVRGLFLNQCTLRLYEIIMMNQDQWI